MMELHGFFLGFIIFVSSWLFCKAVVHPKGSLQTAEIGREGRVVYVVHKLLEPDPSHLCQGFECRTPHGPCNNTDKYQVVSFSEPISFGPRYSWECGIRIKDVSDSDAGVYMICRRDKSMNRCLDFIDMNVTLSVWRRDRHGRICTTTIDSTTRKHSNNCTLLTTTETPTTTDIGEQKQEGNRSLCKRNILMIAVVVVFSMSIIFAIGVVIRRRYRRSRRRIGYELGVRVPNGDVPPATPSSNGQAIQGDSEDNDSE